MNTVILIILVLTIETTIFWLVGEIRKQYWWKKAARPDNRFHCFYVEATAVEKNIRKQKSHLMLCLHAVEFGWCASPATQKERDELKAIIEKLENKI